jgi:hypothetical protein
MKSGILEMLPISMRYQNKALFVKNVQIFDNQWYIGKIWTQHLAAWRLIR